MNDSSPLSPPTRADSGLETVIPKAVAVTTAGGLDTIIPKPVAVTTAGGTFSITASTQIHVAPETDAVIAIGNYLAERLRPATGYALPVLASNAAPAGQIALTIVGSDPALGDEGYVLTIAPDGVTIIAARPAGLFYGVQTLRQLLPPSIEHSTAQPGPWKLPAGTIRDNPRFEWRGAMLDVARHFFGVADVKHYIDLLAYYKLNRLHLHLSDDQGWRIQIDSWPNLTAHGGSTQVGGGKGNDGPLPALGFHERQHGRTRYQRNDHGQHGKMRQPATHASGPLPST